MAQYKDAFNIHGLIPKFPEQIIAGLGIRFDFKPYKISKDSNYVICGMGGSSQIDDFLKNFFSSVNEGVHIYTSRDYMLPREANKKSLVVVISYSGNTEESISCYREAKKRGMKMIAMASGGKLETMAKRDKTPFVRIPGEEEGITQPRYSLSYQFSYHIKILQRHGLIGNHDREIVKACEEVKKFRLESRGKDLAKAMQGRYPILYSDTSYLSTLRMGSIKLYENAKVLAHWNVLPEMNHNEMNGWVFSKKQGKFFVLAFEAPDIHKRTQKRLQILTKIIEKRGTNVHRFTLQGSSHLARMISGLMLLDWISFYVAQDNGIDPAPVDVVEEFKKLLG